MINKTVYRYDLEGMGLYTKVILSKLEITKETPKSFWIGYNGGKDKIIRKDTLDSYRGFCATTKEKAKNQFIARCEKRIQWYEAYIDQCRVGINII